MGAPSMSETTPAGVAPVPQGVPPQGPALVTPLQQPVPAEAANVAPPPQMPLPQEPVLQEAFASCKIPFRRSQLTDPTLCVDTKQCSKSIPSPLYLRH
jgi:hypothetical protein